MEGEAAIMVEETVTDMIEMALDTTVGVVEMAAGMTADTVDDRAARMLQLTSGFRKKTAGFDSIGDG